MQPTRGVQNWKMKIYVKARSELPTNQPGFPVGGGEVERATEKK